MSDTTATRAAATPAVITSSGCLIYHPQNEEERANIWANFQNARATADPVNMMVTLCQLKPCDRCGYRPPAGTDIPGDDTTAETASPTAG